MKIDITGLDVEYFDYNHDIGGYFVPTLDLTEYIGYKVDEYLQDCTTEDLKKLNFKITEYIGTVKGTEEWHMKAIDGGIVFIVEEEEERDPYHEWQDEQF